MIGWVRGMGLVICAGQRDGCCATKFVVGLLELVYYCMHLDPQTSEGRICGGCLGIAVM